MPSLKNLLTISSLLLLLPSATVANPTQARAADDVSVVANTIVLAAQADSCDIIKCAEVIASAACIIAGIAAVPESIPGILGCVAGGAGAVGFPSPCALLVLLLGACLKADGCAC